MSVFQFIFHVYASLRNWAFFLLSHDWAGLVPAAAVALLGWWGIHVGQAMGPIWVTWLGYVLLAIAVLLALGSIRHLIHMARVHAKYPPPGKLVDIGGYRLHLLAEGEAGENPTIVWVPGGHSAGFGLYHLHKVFREETRSILIDRPGTGWSDIGPFPRSTAREAAEVATALEKAGEKGPFVFAGHSFGGLLTANIARRYPEIVAGLVLLDATPPDSVIYGPSEGRAALAKWRGGFAKTALLCLFGIYPDGEKKLAARYPEVQRVNDIIAKQLGSAGETLAALGSRAAPSWATVSIFEELSAPDLAARGWETVVYDGELGDLVVIVLAPATFDTSPEAVRTINFGKHVRDRYLATSSRSQRVYVPEGIGHNFPYEAPECVIDVMRGLLPAAKR